MMMGSNIENFYSQDHQNISKNSKFLKKFKKFKKFEIFEDFWTKYRATSIRMFSKCILVTVTMISDAGEAPMWWEYDFRRNSGQPLTTYGSSPFKKRTRFRWSQMLPLCVDFVEIPKNSSFCMNRDTIISCIFEYITNFRGSESITIKAKS